MNSIGGNFSVGAGVTYRANPATLPATLDPRIEPCEFAALYAAAP
jgi:hypothetical protein